MTTPLAPDFRPQYHQLHRVGRPGIWRSLVGSVLVLVLVFLLGSTDEWWMVIALPVTALVAYCAAWGVTSAVVGDEPEPAGARTPYDVR